MSDGMLPFGPGGIAVIAVYLLSLLVIGWFGHRAKRANTLRDFYLGGTGIGTIALLLTLYATQYSGNTMLGFSGRAYRSGFSFLVSVHFMTAIIICYLLIAPQLHRLGKRHGFITPTDYLRQRFRSRALHVVAPLVMIAALGNYLLAQMIAMGRALQGLTTLPPNVAFIGGVLGLAAIILVYENLGGFRAVAWTDVIQGLVLMAGFFILIGLLFQTLGSLAETTSRLLEGGESDRIKTLPPEGTEMRRWFSYIVIVGLGASLYPQAVQRIFAAKSESSLRRSLGFMALLPLTTALVVVLVGVVGAAHVPNLTAAESDQILTRLCREVQSSSLFGYWLVVVLFAAILGALMSTADSCLLTLSSMITKDIYRGFINPQASEERLTTLGKLCSVITVFCMAALAIYLNQLEQKPTLVKLLDMKFDMLVQLVPAFFIGLHWRGLKTVPVTLGLVAGLVVTFSLYDLAIIKSLGIHAGLYGLAVNLVIAVGGSRKGDDKAKA